MINNHTGQHPTLDTITRITTAPERSSGSAPQLVRLMQATGVSTDASFYRISPPMFVVRDLTLPVATTKFVS